MSIGRVIGTAGHIDHGKTSLVRALTGIDTDRLKEEKERGITIELGFAHLALPSGASVGVVDVPGHERFVRAMVAGAVGMDVVVLPGIASSPSAAKVRGVQVHGAAVDEAMAGQRTAVNLGVAREAIERGEVLVEPGALEAGRLLDVRIRYLATCKAALRR